MKKYLILSLAFAFALTTKAQIFSKNKRRLYALVKQTRLQHLFGKRND